MITMTSIKRAGICVFCAGLLLTGTTANAEKVLDNFERYVDGSIIGDGPSSLPWRRFGEATNDNIVVTENPNRIISGARSAQYCAIWPYEFGAIRYTFNAPTDLTEYTAVGFLMRSTDIKHAENSNAKDHSATYTTVALAISNGDTTYESKPVPLTTKTQSLAFYLAKEDLVLADGEQTLSQVLTAATEIGMTFYSREGLYTETIVFDDLKLLTQQVATSEDTNNFMPLE